jgi:hypothetical protein
VLVMLLVCIGDRMEGETERWCGSVLAEGEWIRAYRSQRRRLRQSHILGGRLSMRRGSL